MNLPGVASATHGKMVHGCSWDETYYNDELYAWYGDRETYWDYSDGTSEDWQGSGWQESGWTDDGEVPEPDQSEDNHNNAETQEYFKGKGKGHGGRSPLMGLGCRICGSKWHNAHSCPLGDRQPGFNNKGKSYGKPKGSGYGKGDKGKGKFPRKGYGKSKGFGKKGKPWKGSGKRTLWSDTAATGYADYYGGAYLANYQDKPMPSLVSLLAESVNKFAELERRKVNMTTCTGWRTLRRCPQGVPRRARGFGLPPTMVKTDTSSHAIS